MGELPATGLVTVDPDDPAQLEALARLHEWTLPDSVPARFGRRFMTRFYFPKLIRDGLAGADLFRCEGAWAGYITYTDRPRTLLRDGVRRNFLFLCGFVPTVFLAEPRSLRAIPKLLANRGGFPERPRTGYLLTLGVHPDFRGRRVGDIGISRHLLARALTRLHELGCQAVEGTVESTNERALHIYRSLGFSIEDRGFGGGTQLQIRLDLAPA